MPREDWCATRMRGARRCSSWSLPRFCSFSRVPPFSLRSSIRIFGPVGSSSIGWFVPGSPPRPRSWPFSIFFSFVRGAGRKNARWSNRFRRKRTMQNSNFAEGAQLPAAGWKTRVQMEADERRTLAPFAQKSGDSRGRQFPEEQHAYRTEFQRDRARIIHSRAFRRLEYKTQVFLN